MPGPLSGYRVLELTSTVSGPMAAMILADQGADVIKIEPPLFGDTARYLGSSRAGMGAMFAVLNRNKRSVALDLKVAAEKDAFLALAQTADVVIENYRPGVVQSLGIDYEALSARNPGLVYASISGYGQDGPYQNRRVFDPLIQATAGTAAEQGGEIPANMRAIVYDKVTALTTSQAVTAALIERGRTGLGQYLPISMLDSALYYMWPDMMWSRTLLGDDIQHKGELADYFPIFRARDGYVSIVLVSDESLEMLSIWRGSELHLDVRYSTLPARLARAAAFKIEVEALLAEVSTDEICEMMDAFGVPVARVNTLDNVHDDEQVRHAGSLVESEHPRAGRMRYPRPPARFAVPVFPERHAPYIGDDTREVLASVGVADDIICALEDRDALNAATLQAEMDAAGGT
ncbi:MAG: CoA transferase [Acidimicrobiaceae bacterium]|nr:CoA transferase [Acidimicrobiaceae bacterium]